MSSVFRDNAGVPSSIYCTMASSSGSGSIAVFVEKSAKSVKNDEVNKF